MSAGVDRKRGDWWRSRPGVKTGIFAATHAPLITFSKRFDSTIPVSEIEP